MIKNFFRNETYVAALIAVLLLGGGVAHAAFYRTATGSSGFHYGFGYGYEEGPGFGYGFREDELGEGQTADQGFFGDNGAATDVSASVTQTSFTVSYSLNYDGSTEVEYGTTTDLGTHSSDSDNSHQGSGDFSITIPALTCNTTYYYRVDSVDAGDHSWSAPETYATITTSACDTTTTHHHSGGRGGSSVPGATTVTTTSGDPAATLAALQAQLQALLAQVGGGTGGVATTVRDLTIGDRGTDVTALQTLLIAQGYSIPAGATGFFVNQTKAALAAYQSAHGIAPAVGYFGAITRAQMKAAGLSGLWW